MAILSLTDFQIGASVGHGGANDESDVRLVQELLRQCNLQPGESTLNPGPVNGVCSRQTIHAIETFQRRFMHSVDGRVDPDGQTHKNLLAVTFNDNGACVSVNATGRELAKLLLTRIGQVYYFGAAVPKENFNWVGPWDCAEFVAWGIYQVSGRLVGCRAASAPNGIRYANAYTGYFEQDLPGVAIEITAEEAADTLGAIALRSPHSHRTGHIAVSRGAGRSIEAYDTHHGVISTDFLGKRRGWTSFWRLRALAYEDACSFL
jgi:hypothetical protein